MAFQWLILRDQVKYALDLALTNRSWIECKAHRTKWDSSHQLCMKPDINHPYYVGRGNYDPLDYHQIGIITNKLHISLVAICLFNKKSFSPF